MKFLGRQLNDLYEMQGDGRPLEDNRFYVQSIETGNKLVPIDQWLTDLAEVMKEWRYEDTSNWEKYDG